MAAKANTVSTHDFNNYMRLQLIVHISNEPLCHLFVKQWDLTIGKAKWEDTDENRKDFINGPGKQLYQNARLVKKEIMGSRNIKDWDMQLLIQAIKSIKLNVSGVFRELKNLRNKVSYLELEVSNEDFEKYWNDISLLLLELGLFQNDIDEIKSKPIEIKLIEQNILNSKVRSLKDFGNQAFQKGEFKKAVDFYTQAICLSGIPCDEVAMLYSNCSVAFLRLGDIASAKEDAKVSVQLSLTWWKSYYRLAMVHKAEEQYELCLKNLLLCQHFHPKPDNIIEEIVLSDRLIGQKKKEEHIQPMQFWEEDMEYVKKLNDVVSPNAILQACDEPSKKLFGAFIMYEKGIKYYKGLGVAQNYVKAAAWYHAAASEGIPEAVYSLAKMYLDGIGVERDHFKGMQLLQQAASMPTLVEVNLYGQKKCQAYEGVAASQHSLGVMYEQGIGVTKDLTKAKFWYEKAIKNWSGAAANNMAMMCLNGVGVPKSLPSAVQYWKLGAAMENIKCMENLVNIYFESKDFGNMQQWYLYAVHRKSEIGSNNNEYKKHFQKSVAQNFKPTNFTKSLWRAIEKGPLKRLIDDRLKKFFVEDKKSRDKFHTDVRTERSRAYMQEALLFKTL